jgi:hypothetical protein
MTAFTGLTTLTALADHASLANLGALTVFAMGLTVRLAASTY